MSRGFSLTVLALMSLPISNAAIAGVAENMGGVADLLKGAAPVTKAQYDSSDAGGLCWYDQGWRGPGWYLCGDEWDYGVGWFGLHRNRHRHLHGIAIAHPVRESHRAVRVPGRPGVRIGGTYSIHRPRAGFAWTRSPSRDVSVAHRFGGAGAVYHSYGAPARSIRASAAPGPSLTATAGRLRPGPSLTVTGPSARSITATVAPVQPCTAAQARSFPALAAAPRPTALLRQGPPPISAVGARMASAALVFLRPDTEWATEAPRDFATSDTEFAGRKPLAGSGPDQAILTERPSLRAHSKGTVPANRYGKAEGPFHPRGPVRNSQ